MKLDQWAKLFIDDKRRRNLSPESITTYRSHVRLFINWHAVNYRIQSPLFLSSKRLQEYTLFMIENGLSAKSINNRLKAVNQFISFMRQNGAQIRSLHAEMVRCDEPHKKTFQLSEIKSIIDHLDIHNPDSVLTIFLLSTGVRSKTARAIKVEDIDFNARILELRHLKNRKYLSIPLADSLLLILKQYIAHHALQPTDNMFFNKFGHALTRSTIYERIKRYLMSIGIEKTGVHIFRYSYAKISVMNGIDSVSLQRLLTHQKIDESSQYVTLYSPELARKQNAFNVLSNSTYTQLFEEKYN